MDYHVSQLLADFSEMKSWASNYGDIEMWKKTEDWNQDKTDAYGYAMMRIYEFCNVILHEKSEILYGETTKHNNT